MELKFSSGTLVNPLHMLSQTWPQSQVLLVHVHTYLAALVPQPGVACLHVLGQTWSQSQVLLIHVLIVWATITCLSKASGHYVCEPIEGNAFS